MPEKRCGMLGGDARGQRVEQGPRRGVAELDDAVALARVARRGHDAMDTGGDDPVRQPLEHHAGVDDDLAVGRDGIDPCLVDQHLQPGRGGPGQGGDEVDVAVGAGPHVGLVGSLFHGRVADRAGERGAVGGHLVEQRLVAAEAFGDDPQKPALQQFDGAVERVQHLGDAGDGRLGQQLRAVAVRVAIAERMPHRQGDAPVQHLLPVGNVAARGGLDEQAGVPGLSVALGGDEALLGVL